MPAWPEAQRQVFRPTGGWPDKLRLRFYCFRIEPVRTGANGEPGVSNRELVARDRDQRPFVICPEFVQPARANRDREGYVVSRASCRCKATGRSKRFPRECVILPSSARRRRQVRHPFLALREAPLRRCRTDCPLSHRARRERRSATQGHWRHDR
jgi:hypothetical protein